MKQYDDKFIKMPSRKLETGDINSLPLKTTPVDGDIVLIEDSADGYKNKKVLKSSIGGTPAGADTQVQVRQGGVFAGDSQFVFNPTTKQLSVGVVEGAGYTGTLQNNGGGSWSKYKDITVTAPAQNLATGYSVKVIITGADATTIFAGGQNALRLEYQVGFVELNRFIETFTSSNVSVWFRLQTGINANQTNNNYRLYYGNSLAGTAPALIDNVFTKNYGETGLRALYHMDEGTGLPQDSSGQGNHTTSNNATWQTTDGGQWDGQVNTPFSTGGHLLFDGVDDYIDLPNSILSPAGEATISLWVKPNVSDAGRYIWVYTSGADTPEIRIYTGTNAFSAVGYDNGAYQWSINSPTIADFTSRWHHLVISWRNNEVYFLVDGVVVGQDASSGIINSTSNQHRLGYYSSSGSRFSGRMDEVRIYNRFVSIDESNAHYKRRMWVAGDTVAIDGNFAVAGASVALGQGSGLLAINSSNATGAALTINTTGAGNALNANGNIALTTAGNKLLIKTGTNASAGITTLVGGTKTIYNTLVTDNSMIQLTKQSDGNNGSVGISSRTAGVSFTIMSSNVADTTQVAWWIIELIL